MKKSVLDKELEHNANVVLTLSVISLIVIATAIVVIYANSKDAFSSGAIFDKDNDVCPQANRVERDWCYLERSKNENENYCVNINNKNLQKFCLAYVNDKPETCEEITDNLVRDGCYINLAVKNNDTELCELSIKTSYCEKQVTESS